MCVCATFLAVCKTTKAADQCEYVFLATSIFKIKIKVQINLRVFQH